MLGNLKEKLAGTRETFKERFEEILRSSKTRDEILDELTESMILADVGVTSTEKIIHSIRQKSKKMILFKQLKKY